MGKKKIKKRNWVAAADLKNVIKTVHRDEKWACVELAEDLFTCMSAISNRQYSLCKTESDRLAQCMLSLPQYKRKLKENEMARKQLTGELLRDLNRFRNAPAHVRGRFPTYK